VLTLSERERRIDNLPFVCEVVCRWLERHTWKLDQLADWQAMEDDAMLKILQRLQADQLVISDGNPYLCDWRAAWIKH
jgi:hypothetical protein